MHGSCVPAGCTCETMPIKGRRLRSSPSPGSAAFAEETADAASAASSSPGSGRSAAAEPASSSSITAAATDALLRV